MKFWRDIANDRLSGGLLCVLLLLSFGFQIVTAGRAAAAMAAPDALSLICSSSSDGTHRSGEGEPAAPCPCSELCSAGLYVQSPPAPSDAAGIAIRFASRIEIAVDRSAPLSASSIGRRYDARGPPQSSI